LGGNDVPTNYRFTGQKEEPQLKLYFYNARWYDPQLGRFIQADKIVPNPMDSQQWDRYLYVLNNPFRFIDPSGHEICNIDGYCGPYLDLETDLWVHYGIDFDDKFKLTFMQMYQFLLAALGTANEIKDILGSHDNPFKRTLGKITTVIGPQKGPRDPKTGELLGNCETNYGSTGSTISCELPPGIGTIVHELIHVLDKRYQELSTVDDNDPNCHDCMASDYFPWDWLKKTEGYICPTCLSHSFNDPEFGLLEAFANLGENWIMAELNIDPASYGFTGDIGFDMLNWIVTNMPIFLANMGLK
jgi:RHS repeat-associated protein